MRTEVTPEDESLVAIMYVNKNKPTVIAEKTGYSNKIVKEILENNRETIDELRYSNTKLSMDDKLDMIPNLYRRGYEVENIHRILSISFPIILDTLEKSNSLNNGKCTNTFATTDRVKEFAKTVKPGDKYKITCMRDALFDDLTGTVERAVTVKVLKIYPHFVITDKGDFKYFELFTGRKIK